MTTQHIRMDQVKKKRSKRFVIGDIQVDANPVKGMKPAEGQGGRYSGNKWFAQI